MTYIKGIKLSKELLENYEILTESGDKTDILEPLNKLNIFIGSNNSGKSRLLRSLLKIKRLEYKNSDFNYDKFKEHLVSTKEKVIDFFHRSGITLTSKAAYVQKDFQNLLSEISPENLTGAEPDVAKAYQDLVAGMKNYQQKGMSTTSNHNDYHPKLDGTARDIELLNLISWMDAGFPQKDLTQFSYLAHKKIYIPVLRGLRPPVYPLNHQDRLGDIYQARTQTDYFNDLTAQNGDPEIHIFAGLDLYEEIRRLLLSNLNDRNLVRDYEMYLGKTFFDGATVTLIPHVNHDVLTVKIGKEHEKPIYHLGDGLQSLIVATFPIFKEQRLNPLGKFIVCIEEPELYIHPGLQRVFMAELLSERYKNFQFFVTTHSNHFLDLIMDYEGITIFSVNKTIDHSSGGDEVVPGFKIENLQSDKKKTLEILGIRNSSVFLSNATIWVEGITDRMYLRHYFQLWQNEQITKIPNFKRLKEDSHFSFVEYGGSNITHWSFLDDEGDVPKIKVQSIVSKILLVADSDDTEINSNSKKSDRLRLIKKKLGDDNFIKLPRREIENLILPDVLIKSVQSNKSSAVIKKTDIDYVQYKDERMGEFIDRTLLGLGVSKKSFSNKYGAIKDKVSFAHQVIKHTSFETLSPDAKAICKKMYKFVSECNGFNNLTE